MLDWYCPRCSSANVVVTDEEGDTIAECQQDLDDAAADGDIQSTEGFAFLCLSCGETEVYSADGGAYRETPEDREEDEFWQAADYYYDRAHGR